MRAFLVMADIGGYTRFMRLHQLSLVHAQDNTDRLLEAVIEAAPSLELVDLEGDAAFFYVPEPKDEQVAETIAALAAQMHRAFHERQASLEARRMCICDACKQTGRLSVKFVAHAGEIVQQQIGRTTKLAGVDVILLHRLLKNSVPVREYLLMTETVLERCSPEIRAQAVPLDQEIEELGTQHLHYLDLEQTAAPLPPPPRTTLGERLRHEAGMTVRGLPYLVRVKRPRARSA